MTLVIFHFLSGLYVKSLIRLSDSQLRSNMILRNTLLNSLFLRCPFYFVCLFEHTDGDPARSGNFTGRKPFQSLFNNHLNSFLPDQFLFMDISYPNNTAILNE
jgi:hypothetical protein